MICPLYIIFSDIYALFFMYTRQKWFCWRWNCWNINSFV